MESKLVKHQTKKYRVDYNDEQGNPRVLVATVRHDDECNNRHNSFAITGTLYDRTEPVRGEQQSAIHKPSGKQLWVGACGCLHEEIEKHIPELAKYLKWQLCSTDGPMHYIANTLYWLGYKGRCDGRYDSPPNLKYARGTAAWPELPESYICHPDVRLLKITRDAAEKEITSALEARLPALLIEFKHDVEELGLVF